MKKWKIGVFLKPITIEEIIIFMITLEITLLELEILEFDWLIKWAPACFEFISYCEITGGVKNCNFDQLYRNLVNSHQFFLSLFLLSIVRAPRRSEALQKL